MQATAKAIVQEGFPVQAVDDLTALTIDELEGIARLEAILSVEGDLTPYLSNEQIATIGANCKQDYEDDCSDRSDWKEKAETAIKRAKQEELEEKLFPWKGASNASFPLLTTAALQFAARAYPAIVKGDEVVSCKVVGADKGLPVMGPDGKPQMSLAGMPIVGEHPQGLVLQTPAGPALAAMGPQGMVLGTPQGDVPLPPDVQPEPMWEREPGAKTKRADRVKDFMNYTVFYKMKGWEEDTDTLLHHLPIIGCGFRKVYVAAGQQRCDYVPALKLVAPMNARSCEESPRLTEIREGQRLNDIIGMQRTGFYRDVVLVEEKDDAGLRTLLEQHCLIDLDDDGYAEPYVVTLDEQSGEVLRVERNFSVQDVEMAGDRVTAIRRECYYIKYDFFPNLDGGFYGLGLGHLLDSIMTIVNNTINQMIDSGTAAAAGGGFIGSGVDLAGAGKRSSSIRFSPGEYKTIGATGSKLREAIYERTFPGPNPVTFQVLELMLGAAKDISSIKDVLSGEASNNGQVGTTLALIEQGLQMFTAIYKRIYRSLKEEYSKLFRNIGLYGGEAAQADYVNILDDMEASFEDDFNSEDFDIRPVSDPTNVTKLQKMGRAQFLMQFAGAPGMDAQEIIRRSLEAADIEDIETLFIPPSPPQPDPEAIAGAEKDMAMAGKYKAETAKIAQDAELDAGKAKLEALAEAARLGELYG